MCAIHGAGYRKKPGGRPPRHGLRLDPGVVLSRLKKQKTGLPLTDSLHALALASVQLDLAIEELLRRREAGRPLPLEMYGYIIELCDMVGRNAERVAKGS